MARNRTAPRHLTVYVNADVAKRLARMKKGPRGMNMSAICSAALAKELDRKEAASARKSA